MPTQNVLPQPCAASRSRHIAPVSPVPSELALLIWLLRRCTRTSRADLKGFRAVWLSRAARTWTLVLVLLLAQCRRQFDHPASWSVAACSSFFIWRRLRCCTWTNIGIFPCSLANRRRASVVLAFIAGLRASTSPFSMGSTVRNFVCQFMQS